jgi:DNA-damage-inducible protein J
MPSNALVQTRIDPEIRDRAAAVLDRVGLSVSDAVRILLTRTANEGVLPFDVSDKASHDAWFRAMVQEALDDQRPTIPAETVEQKFAAMRAASLKKLNPGAA